VQISILNRLLHRDLCNPEHKTNVHLHHHVLYPPLKSDDVPPSYFDPACSSLIFEQKDTAVHKPLTMQQFLDKKLRWMTLGGQYDWTNKVYPSGPPPPFPPDVKQLVEGIFPMKAEAAIVNLYSPGDTLSLHRDVSEECDQPLVSISLGCDGIFVVGLDDRDNNEQTKTATIRLRSGDAVLMSGESRFAWHGIPKVLESTCPEWLENWPFRTLKDDDDGGNRFQQWKGWMKGKRINLNVRQMFA
jgi:DNA alkylation damage repair protein AlkB